MDNGLNIKISTVIESSAEIQKKLQSTLNKITGSIKISNIDIDDKAIRKIQNLINGLNSGGKNISLIDLKDTLNQLELIKANGKDLFKSSTGEVLQLQKEFQKINNDREKALQYEQRVRRAITNEELKAQQQLINEQNKLVDAMAKGRENSTLKSKEIDRQLEINQAKAINKALEEEYQEKQKNIKAQQQLNEAITNYEAKMDNSIRKLQAGKHGSFVPTEDLNEFKKNLQSISEVKNMDEFVSKTKVLNNEFGSLTARTQELHKEHMGLYSTLKHNFQMFSEFYIVGGIFMGFVNSIKSAVTSVVEMDTALTNLNKVVDMSKSQLEDMKNSAIQMGKELGQSATSIVEGMAEWGRVTKNLDEIKELTKTSTLASNVTDLSVADASKSIESAMIQFKLQAKDAMGVVDQWNEIQNNFATSAEDLADGISKVGSVAQQSGTPIQALEGYVTALVSSMKIDGSEAGTALKSIISRVYRVGAEGAEDAGNAEKRLSAIGVQVRKSATEFNSFDNILQQLSVKWDTLSDAEKLNLEQTLGGTQHYTKVTALLENMKIATDATTTAYNSQNSAISENEKYLNSIEGRYQVLKTTLEEKFNSAISSDFIKGTVSGLTKLLDIFGNVPMVVGLATTAFLVFKGVAIKESLLVVSELTASVGVLSTAEIALGGATDFLTMSFNTLTTAIARNPIGFIAVGITTLITTIALLNTSLEDTTQKIEELSNKTSEVKSIDSLVSKYEELQAKIDADTKAGIDNKDAKSQLLDIQKQFAQTFKDSISGYDAEGNAIIDNISKVKELNEAKKEQLITDAKIEYNKLKSQYTPNKTNPFNGETTNPEIEKYLLGLKNRQDAIDKGDTDKAGKINDSLKTYVDNFNKFNEQAVALYNLGYKDVEVIDLQTGSFKKYSEVLTQTARNADGTKSSFESMTESIDSLTKKFDNSMDSISGYNKLIDDYNKNGHFSSDSVKEIIDKHQELAVYLNNEPTLYAKIQEAINNEKNEADKAYQKIMQSSNEWYSQNVAGTNKVKEALGDFYNNLSDAQKNDLQNAKNLAQAKVIVERDLIKELSGLWSEYLQAEQAWLSGFQDLGIAGAASVETPESKEMVEKLQKYQALQDKLKSVGDSFDKITADISAPSNLGNYGSSLDKNTKSTNASKEATDQYSLAMSALNNKLDEYDNRLKNVSKSSQEYRNILLEKQKLIQQEIDLTKQQINLQDQIAKSGGGTSSYSGAVSSVASAGSSIGQTIISEAQKYIGTKYTYGGTSPNTGFDCSG